MPSSSPEGRSLSDDIGYIIGIAILILIFVNAGATGVLANLAEEGGIKANPQDYFTFGVLYRSTFMLSFTLTMAVAVYAIPRLYSHEPDWTWPAGVMTLGAVLTGMSLPWRFLHILFHGRFGAVIFIVVALVFFAYHYGVSFFWWAHRRHCWRPGAGCRGAPLSG